MGLGLGLVTSHFWVGFLGFAKTNTYYYIIFIIIYMLLLFILLIMTIIHIVVTLFQAEANTFLHLFFHNSI